MFRDFRVYLDDILESTERILNYTKDDSNILVPRCFVWVNALNSTGDTNSSFRLDRNP